MNILIIINSFRLGGAEKLCYDLAYGLSLKKGTYVFLYSVGKVENELEVTLFKRFERTKVKVGSFDKAYKKQRIRTAIKIKKFCKDNKIDVVHTNGQSPDFLMRFSKLIGNNSKIVTTIHNTIGYSRIQENLLGRFTDIYTAVSNDALRYSKEILGITKEMYLIENGIDLQMYADIDRVNNFFEVLSVGRVEPQKDYIKAADFLAPFLNKHKEVKWKIYGDYTSNLEYCCNFRKKIEQLGIEKSVEFKGVITDPKEIYQHGNVFVLASSFEGFGIAFIEAIMSDHFIFSREVGVIQDILNSGGIIHNVDAEESLEILDNIYNDKVSCAEIEKNKQIISKKYSVKRMLNNYYSIYERAVKK